MNDKIPKFAEIAINIPAINKVFHYHIPDSLQRDIVIGQLVGVPFGQKYVQGVVTNFLTESRIEKTKPINMLFPEEHALTTEQIHFAKSVSSATLSPLGACIKLMLPPGISQNVATKYSLVPDYEQTLKQDAKITKTQKEIISLLNRRGELTSSQIDRAMPRKYWRSPMRSLQNKDMILAESILSPPKVKPQKINLIQLIGKEADIISRFNELARKGTKAYSRRKKMLDYLLKHPDPVSSSILYAESGGNLDDIKKLVQLNLISLWESEFFRDPIFQFKQPAASMFRLTDDQLNAWETIISTLDNDGEKENNDPILLHGVTGSGKTELYLHAVAHVLERGQSAAILVPEISLTPQMVRRFIARFPGEVGLFHSALSDGERYDTWRRVKRRDIRIVIGPRSALFAPYRDLGLIVLDESHDDSYFQFDTIPHYNARTAAIILSNQIGATCILGSATPSMESMHKASRGGYQYIHLPKRILTEQYSKFPQGLNGHSVRELPEAFDNQINPEEPSEILDLPPIEVVDMREELKGGNRSIFSKIMQAELHRVMERNEQAILFLNRLGSSTYVFCRDCGTSVHCTKCGDMPMTYHKHSNKMICHRCNDTRNRPTVCPNCGSRKIRQYGTGTEKVEEEVRKILPNATIFRWDRSTTTTKGAHDAIMQAFVERKADILVGTQMLAKGLDLPAITLVGIILADVGLNFPDYRTAEKTFQILEQVSGRAGRSLLGGKVVLQTFNPDHYVIKYVRDHDYEGFYKEELSNRKKIGYPPYTRLVRLLYKDTDPRKAKTNAFKMVQIIKDWIEKEPNQQVKIIGPVPAYYSKLGGFYRWQIVLRGKDPASILRGKNIVGWVIEVDPISLL